MTKLSGHQLKLFPFISILLCHIASNNGENIERKGGAAKAVKVSERLEGHPGRSKQTLTPFRDLFSPSISRGDAIYLGRHGGDVLLRSSIEMWGKISSSLTCSLDLEGFASLSDPNCSQRLEGFVGLCYIVAHVSWAGLSTDLKGVFVVLYSIFASHTDQIWYVCPCNQRASLVAHYPDNNKGWHKRYFFMSSVGWEHFPCENLRSESSLCCVFGSVPKCHKREVPNLNRGEWAQVATIADSHSGEAEGSSHHSSSKKRKMSPPVASDAEEEKGEVPLDRRSSKYRTNTGSEDVPRIFSPISGVHAQVMDPEVRDVPEVGVPSFSLVPASDLPETPNVDYLDVVDEDLPSTPLGPTNTVVLVDCASSSGLDSPEARVDFVVQSEVLPPSGVLPVISPSVEVPYSQQPCVLGASIIGCSGVSGSVPAGEPNALVANVAGGFELPLVSLAKGKEHVVFPSALDCSEESDSLPPPPFEPVPRHIRDSTREIALLKAHTGGKLTVHIPDGRTGDDDMTSMLSSHIGALVRQHVPFETRCIEIKCYSITRCPIPKEEVLVHPYPGMNKEEWTRVCDLFVSEEFQIRSAINKENKAKLKIVHTSGARSFNVKKWKLCSCSMSQRESLNPKWKFSLRCCGRKWVTCKV
ncbi:hypothetical protein CJ030_MR7G000039 [Morella rubra]|uniref:Uncharacterized protein n=1 Tax=Morella rubra TaxID=262757 RepID=A0A6A1V1J4_9ROSI|nr:hypothetical protein CJ030_MR7G000039 [Morella rubra]